MKVTFYYVRHGETLFNQVRRMQGNCDSPLTKDGIAQAEETASALRNVHFDHIFCSSSERAWDTAKIIGKYHSAEPVCLKEFKEFDFGKLDGVLFSEMEDRIQPHRMADDWTDVGGENVPLFAERSGKGFEKILASCKDGDTVLIVSHGSFFMHLMKTILHYDQQEYIARVHKEGRPFVPNCSVSMFTCEDGEYTLTMEPKTADEFRALEDKTVTFWMMRHGETVFNQEKRMQGWCDSPLTDAGIAQAEEAAEQLKDVPFAIAYCSTSERARDTAAIVLKDKDTEIVYDKRLREVYFGEMEAEIYEGRLEHLMDLYLAGDYSRYHGEVLEETCERIRTVFRDMTDAAKDGDTILVVSHGDLYLTALTELFGMEKKDVLEDAGRRGVNPTPNCGYAVFENRNGKYRLLRKMDGSTE